MTLIKRLSNQVGWRFFGVSLILLVVFIFVVLPYEAKLLNQASNGAIVPDTRVFYTAEWLYQTAHAFGFEARQAYIISRLRFDILWPLVYVSFFFVTLSLLWKDHPLKHYLLFSLPLALLFDLIENGLVSIVFYNYPKQLRLIASLAGMATLFKWLMIVFAFVGIVVGVFIRFKALYKIKIRKIN